MSKNLCQRSRIKLVNLFQEAPSERHPEAPKVGNRGKIKKEKYKEPCARAHLSKAL